MTPFAKYFWRNGYTSNIGAVVTMMTAYFMTRTFTKPSIETKIARPIHLGRIDQFLQNVLEERAQQHVSPHGGAG